ncbi:UbiA prenyltransferase family-domain-containing protein [Usnea florida]
MKTTIKTSGPQGQESDRMLMRRSALFHLYTIWLFTCNDLKVIVYPETLVGIFNAMTGGLLTTNTTPDVSTILLRTPQVLLWNWINLLTFNIANQRLASSILEDSVNKPWRPLPSNRLSSDEARRLLLRLIPCGLLLSLFLGGLKESVTMLILTWMYNDLGGADENFIVRNLINAIGFICHGSGATLIAAGFRDHEITSQAHIWLTLIGGVIFTTLQVQDLPDMEGDAARGRRTLPLIYGEVVGRYSVAIAVLGWSFICPTFWKLGFLAYILPVMLGSLVAVRVLAMRNVPADQKTYRIWCVWLTVLYVLPLCKSHGAFGKFRGKR